MERRAEEPKDRPFEQLQETASSISKQSSVATAAVTRTGDLKERVDSRLITGARDTSLILGEGEIEGAE
jgi:hypothetical protein